MSFLFFITYQLYTIKTKLSTPKTKKSNFFERGKAFMVTVAIISEYNPFHSGHKYQIDKIREQFGDDTAIVAIMSGNFTQRGEVAFAPKEVRAKTAVLSGVNLVLEIPFPFSASSAEFFARSGVKIADYIGADYLSFGSESGDIDSLAEASSVMLSKEYREEFAILSKNKALGYPERCEMAYRKVSEKPFSFSSNNILALEYIKAINELGSDLIPHTIKRNGAEYDSCEIEKSQHQSAMALRGAFRDDDFTAVKFLPEEAKDVILYSKDNGDLPCDISRISSAFISYLRLNPPSDNEEIHDAGDGLYNRLYNESFKANDISTLLLYTESKNYTRARIRRALLNVFFGVTSSDLKTLPMYTQILAMDTVGMQILKKTRKSDDFQILTKPSDFKHFNVLQLRQKSLSDRADSIFDLTKPVPKSGASSLTFTPYVKK